MSGFWIDDRKPIARHLDFPLKPGRKQAALVVEEAQLEIYKSFDEARCYLMTNIDWITKHYGDRHQVKREDIMIVGSVYGPSADDRSSALYRPNTMPWSFPNSRPEPLSNSTYIPSRPADPVNHGAPGVSSSNPEWRVLI